MKIKKLTKLFALTLATASIFSTNLTLPASATVETFKKFNFDNLNQISKDSNSFVALISTLESLKSKIHDYYTNSEGNIDKDSWQKIKTYCKEDDFIQILQDEINNNENIINENKSIFHEFSKQVLKSIQKPTMSKTVKVIVDGDSHNITEEDKNQLINIFKTKYQKLCNLDRFKELDENKVAEQIVNDILNQKGVPFKPQKIFDNKSQNDKKDLNFVTQITKKIKLKEQLKNKTFTRKETIFDFSEVIQFLIDCLGNFKLKDKLVWSDYFISTQEYNKILNDSFKDACMTNKLITDEKDNIDNIEETIFPSGNIPSAKAIDKTNVKLDKITASKDVLQHILVGSNVVDDTDTISTGHTVYAQNTMKKIIEKNYEKMKSFSNTDSMLKFFEASTGFTANKIAEKLNKTDNSSFDKWHYSQLGRFAEIDKGMFPDNWRWQDIKKAISNILEPANLKYTKQRTKTDQNLNPIKNYRFAHFHGTYQNIPIQVIVNVDEKSLVTAYPMSENDFSKQMSREFDKNSLQCEKE